MGSSLLLPCACTFHLIYALLPSDFTVSRNNGVPPGSPQEFRVESKTKSSVALGWSHSRVDGGAKITAYRLHYHREFGDWDYLDLSANATNFRMGGLKCGTNYQFYLRAVNEFGPGERTETLSISTNGKSRALELSVDLHKLFV